MLRKEVTNIKKVLLVDKDDNVIGFGEKMTVHRQGLLHRAFSIFIFNSDGHLLLQKRAKGKYHSAGLWSNTCCGHQPEDIHARLKEEMGFDCSLTKIHTFTYETKFDNGLTENEVDHVYIGKFDGVPKPNPKEVYRWKWVSLGELIKGIDENPNKYTHWLKELVKKVMGREW